MKKEVVIWWVSQSVYKAIENDPLKQVKARYIRSQLSDRQGRPGRARLWSDNRFGNIGVNPWPETPLSRWIENEDCGGIVIEKKHLSQLKGLPGVFTDLQLNMVAP